MDNIEIKQFANKNVISLPQEASIGEAIRLMYKQGIRHIPILHKTEIVGVVNPNAILTLIAKEAYEIDFDANVSTIMTDAFDTIDGSMSLFEVVANISKNPDRVAIVEETDTIVGIYTESDILDSDFLWMNFTDRALTSDDELGHEISEFHCTTSDNTIHHSIKLMVELKQDFIGIMSPDSKELRGVLSFFEIAHHLYYVTYRRAVNLVDILNQPIHSIFPSSGVYYIEPVLLSQARRDLWVNDSFFLVILDESWEPQRIISIHDIVGHLVGNSDYFG